MLKLKVVMGYGYSSDVQIFVEHRNYVNDIAQGQVCAKKYI